MKSISVLGCGWLGMPLAKELVSKGYTVRGSTTSETKLKSISENGIKPYLVQVDSEGCKADPYFFKSDILIVIIPPSRKEVSKYTEIIRNILKKISPQTKVIFTSTTGVYKNTNKIVNEESITHPTKLTSKEVLIAEGIVKEHPYLILRLAGLVGGNRKAGRFFSGKTDINGGKTPVNLVHLVDCVSIIVKLIERDKWRKTYNICAPDHPNKEKIYSFLAKRENFQIPTFLHNTLEYKIVDSTKVVQDLEYSFIFSSPYFF